MFQPIRSATQVWLVARHQYGISAPISQTLFRGETTGGVTEAQLFSRATFSYYGRKKALGENRSVRTGVTKTVFCLLRLKLTKFKCWGTIERGWKGVFQLGNETIDNPSKTASPDNKRSSRAVSLWERARENASSQGLFPNNSYTLAIQLLTCCSDIESAKSNKRFILLY